MSVLLHFPRLASSVLLGATKTAIGALRTAGSARFLGLSASGAGTSSLPTEVQRIASMHLLAKIGRTKNQQLSDSEPQVADVS